MAVKEVFNKSKRVFLFAIVAVITLTAGGAALYFYQQYQQAQNLLKNPTLSAQQEQQSLIDKVGKLMELPKDEQPTIATVSDVTKLKGQSFFANAKNGFKVLIYAKAKKAILYDPVSNKIIDIGPINIGEQSAAPSPAISQAPVKVALYNGTKTVGFASTIEKQLKEKSPKFTVVSKGNARLDHKKTIVVDLVGTQKTAAAQLAKLISGEVGQLPQGEVKPSASSSADLLVILGKE